ncbi:MULTISPECIES: TniB family NTP-binding protein [Hyphomicrobiales]|uniref:TniB family NTP-binding protein n=1 Tax=Hyphomicrobiales TaxID=356 RepID=UPI0010293098|nr:TniB family NTP-binding protein [Phyllobacterium myrsinacearum]RZS83893.1 TniB protein [Phyllobacterium myrsinacearum]
MTNFDAKNFFNKAAARLLSVLTPEAADRAKKRGGLYSAYITSDRHQRVERAVSKIVENAAASVHGTSGRRRALFVIGESGSGKSTALQNTLLKRAELQPYRNDEGEMISPMIYFDMPKPLKLRLLATKIIKATGYPLINADRIPEYDLFELAKRVLKEYSVLVLFIDEAQHALKETDKATIRNLADILKSLLQIEDWPLHLVLAGVPALAKFIEHEPQLRNRSLVVELERVTFPGDLERIRVIAQGIIETHAGMKVDGALLQDMEVEDVVGGRKVKKVRKALTEDLVHRLIHASEGGFGTIIDLVRMACDFAIEVGSDVVGLAHFVECYDFLTGCQPHHNIFLAADWKDLTPVVPLAELVARQAVADARIEAGERNRKRGGK